ncbi:Na/Pi cotransporter family protein [Methylopila sp. 73B]|uniref:Na/Pi cotransporter family protein n=1 Tax=Methylopila sp. 73B TaxID=1120792 RepID=UPI00037D2A49|nr:Na/Pi cotransporter family protein [Methylopila sp. 73B]
MSATHVLIELLGEVALLLWGVHVVSSGVQRAFGSDLRHMLGEALRNRGRAFLAGVGVTALLQSSTATALMIASFSGAGAVELAPALAMMLGANVGTTLIVQVASFDVSYVFPLLLFLGVAVYRRGRSSLVRDLAQTAIGLGLMLLALHLLVETMRPIEASATLRMLLGALTEEPLITVLLAAALSWAAHSSVAAMLFVMSLAGAGVISTEAALAMVLGCNLGSALNPLIDAMGGAPAKLRAPLGNLANRLVGCALALPFLGPIAQALSVVDADPARLAALGHLAFNLATAALFIGLLPQLAALLKRALPDRPTEGDPATPLYLDEAALSTPSVALANAAREVLHMADVVEGMLKGSQGAFAHDDIGRVLNVSRTDDVLDTLYDKIQLYIGAIDHDRLSDKETQRVFATLALAINLEHIGDIVDKNLMEMAAQRIRDKRLLPPAAIQRIDAMHARLCEHLRLAVAVFMSGDHQAARRLVAEKEQFRELEREATERHFAEMRSGRADQIETSALQLDITRDLKRIEAHIAATVHGLLESDGQLRASRLAPGRS